MANPFGSGDAIAAPSGRARKRRDEVGQAGVRDLIERVERLGPDGFP
jgi:hypothetical protein